MATTTRATRPQVTTAQTAPSSKQATKLFAKYGPWAVVTGASSGIGREFGRQLGAAGFNLIVAARRIDRLEQLADELTTAHGIEVRAVEADLSDPSGVEAIAKAAADIDLGLVVNNAGGALPGSFLNVSLEDQVGVVDLNISSPLQLAHTLGAQLTGRGRGGYIFVGSTSSFSGAPYLANYAATKAFIGSLGEGLSVEWAIHGVDVLVVHPGPTKTEMTDMDGVDFHSVPMPWMGPDTVAKKALRSLGKRPVLVPGGRNKVMRFMMTRVLPRRRSVAMSGALMGKITSNDLI